MAEMMKR